MAVVVVDSLEDEIRQSVREMGALLAKVTGSGSPLNNQAAGQQRSVVQQQADAILQPLMDFLDGRFVVISFNRRSSA